MVSLDPAALLSLMRLSSPALPIGGFSYSQGLESAIDAGWVGSEAEVCDWIATLLQANIGRFDAPLCMALFRAVALDDDEHAARLHEQWLASRETAELRAETLQMGQSCFRCWRVWNSSRPWRQGSNLCGQRANVRCRLHGGLRPGPSGSSRSLRLQRGAGRGWKIR